MQCEDGLPFDLQLVAFGVDLGQSHSNLLREVLGGARVLVLDQILQDVAVELVLLRLRQHHLQFNYKENIHEAPHPSPYNTHHISTWEIREGDCGKGLSGVNKNGQRIE